MRASRITVRAASTKAAAIIARQPRQSVVRAVELAKLQPMPKDRPGHINVRLVTYSFCIPCLKKRI
jgi:hypothetical protein